MPTEKAPLSVCLIVKNEADRLERTLGALGQGSFAGELLVYVDDSTTDNTVEILKKYSATIIQGPWLGFSATRRLLWSMARYPWVLWVDADEIFPPVTLAAIMRVVSEYSDPALSPVQGYRIRRRVVFQGRTLRHGDWGCDRVLRLFPRERFFMEERSVHESVTVLGPVRDLPGFVEHHSFRSWADLQARSARYAQLWAHQSHHEKRRPSLPWLRAIWKFLRGYVIKSGWLDGPLGFKIALHNAREVFHKYTLLRHLRSKPPVGSVPAHR